MPDPRKNAVVRHPIGTSGSALNCYCLLFIYDLDCDVLSQKSIIDMNMCRFCVGFHKVLYCSEINVILD